MAWLTGWQYRRKFTVDADNIDSALTHFPITLFLNNSAGITDADITDIFDELGASSKKIAITKDDGTTQIYAEIELWDNANEQAVIHCSISDLVISDSTDTELYLYYDSTEDDNTTYIGDTPGSSPVTNVWDSSFKAVYHMKDATTSTVKDSTSNADTGNKRGANEPVEVDYFAGKCQDFDGANDKIVASSGSHLDLSSDSQITIEARVRVEGNGNDLAGGTICGRYGGGAYGWLFYHYRSGNGLYFQGNGAGTVSNVTLTDNTPYTIALQQNASNSYFWKDGVVSTAKTRRAFSTTTVPFEIGDYTGTSTTVTQVFNGKIDEVRITAGARSNSWIKATHYSLIDGLYTWSGREEESTPGIDTYTKLMLHCNGDNESQVFTDSSASAHTITPQNNAELTTTYKKFGTAGGNFIANDAILELNNSTDWDFAKDDFTIDFWYYPTSFTNYRGIIGTQYTYSPGGTQGWVVYTYNNGVVKFSINSAAANAATSGDQALNLNEWNHVAIVRKGTGLTDFNIAINGVFGNAPTTGDVTVNSNGGVMTIGRFYRNIATNDITGYLDELRISKGTARWPTDFIPPTTEYTEETTQISVSDTGTGISVLSLLNSLSVLDVGALLQEILSIINNAIITDTGSDTESLSIINSMTAISDTATALDVLSTLAVYLQITDTTEGTENLSTLKVYSLNDSGAGIDTGAVIAIATLTEDGSGADTLIVTNFIPTQSDSGTTTDALSSIRAVLSITDMGADTDNIKQITVVAASSDSGVNAGEGAFIINAMPLQTDSGTLLSESLTLFVRALLTEYSTASDDDIKNIITNFSLSDSADGLEALLRTIYVDIIYGISKINITESLTSTLPTDPVYGISNVDTSVSTDSDFGSL